jgi:hypothetical protein
MQPTNICASLPVRSTSREDLPDGGTNEIPKTDDEVIVEECIEELDAMVTTLDRYPPGAVAVAIATYLEGLLGALLDERQCTAEEVRELLRQIESGILEPHAAT